VPSKAGRASPSLSPLWGRSTRFWFAVIAATTLLAYSRSFTSPFQFDDSNVIVNNGFLRNPASVIFLSWARTRIVPYLTLALNLKLGGLNPIGYHVGNFIVHLLTVFAVLRLCVALCHTPRLRETPLGGNPVLVAVPAAFLFACHPIQVQAITYVTQRMAAMAAMFYAGSVLLYVRARNAQSGGTPGRSWPSYAASALLALAAFLSKENTASLPIMILLTEWVFFGNTNTRRTLGRLAPFLLLALAIPIGWWFLAGAHSVPYAQTGSWITRHVDRLAAILRKAADPTAASPSDYFLTQCVVVPRYLRLVFLPWGFNLDPDVTVQHGLSEPNLLGLGFLATLLGLGISMTRRSPLLGFGILWFFVALSVESSFLPINDVMAEHRMYLAMPGVALAVSVLFALLVGRSPAITTATGTVIVISLAVLTFARNEIWRSPISLWQDAVSKSPHKTRALINLGVALHEVGRLDEAIQQYCEALRIDPNSQPAATNIEIALDEKLDNGDIDVELFVGKDGAAEVVPIHPCPPNAERRGQKRRKVGVRTHPPSSSEEH
jgi:protein O-mannosyl-transferase